MKPIKAVALGLIMFMIFYVSVALADNESPEILLYSIIQKTEPDCQIFAYAPVGTDGTKYIVLTQDSADRSCVMLVDTDQPDLGVEFCNESIMNGIPLDHDKIQIMDHMLDGHPYVWYMNTDSSESLYVVFTKDDYQHWFVSEAEFGDEICDFYWFSFVERDQQIHLWLTGNEVLAIPSDVFDLSAESFDPSVVRQQCLLKFEPYLNNDKNIIVFDKSAQECYEAVWLMNGAAYDDLLENTAERVRERQLYAVNGTVSSIIPGSVQEAVFDVNDGNKTCQMLISNASDIEWAEGNSYRLYTEAYAYSEAYHMPWLIAGYTFSK